LRPAPTPARGPRLGELARLFLRLGLTAFGGPAAHIALFRHEVVVRRRWLSEQRFLDLLGAASVLPGPTSTEVAIAIGQERAGWRGMLVSGTLFVLPAALIVLLLAMAYERFGSLPQVDWILYGIQPVVIAVVAHALIGLAPSAIRDAPTALIGSGAIALTLLGYDPLLVLGVGAVMLLALRGLALVAGRQLGAVAGGLGGLGGPGGLDGNGMAGPAAVVTAHAVGLGAIFLTFLKMGLLVFGSGYVLIAFLRADFVAPGLLTDRQLLDGVAIGQVTPGPVFTTATFIGYLLAGVPGAIVATIAVFLPSFVLVGLVHPIVPRLRASPVMSALLDGVNAAALGLMAAVSFELARTAVVDAVTAVVAIVSLLVLVRWRVNPAWLLVVGGAVGVVVGVTGRP